jgi:hypothetical protein
VKGRKFAASESVSLTNPGQWHLDPALRADALRSLAPRTQPLWGVHAVRAHAPTLDEAAPAAVVRRASTARPR